jgi:hypothetical protein
MSARKKPNAAASANGGAIPAGLPAAAMTAEAAHSGLDIFEANLRTWRAFADASREALRQQQDAMLAAWRGQLEQGAAQTPLFAGSGAMAPFTAMLNAYMRNAEAVLQLQRPNAQEAASGAER